MYSFQDRGERSLTLRPEGTAPVVRSYVENKMFGDATQPTEIILYRSNVPLRKTASRSLSSIRTIWY